MFNPEHLRVARQKRLNGDGPPIIIDGGMGTELERRGVPMDGKAWSGAAVLERPAIVREVHEDFIAAGAEVIITNTFSSGRHMLEPAGYGDKVEAINRDAVGLAEAAVKRSGRDDISIAGSICEWTTAEEPKWASPESVAKSVGEQARILAAAGVDLIALEMCQRAEFTVPVVEAVREVNLPIWIGISCQKRPDSTFLPVFDHEDRSLESLIGAVAPLEPECINIMHSPVPDVPLAFDMLRSVWSGPIGIYPESGFFKMPHWQFVDVIEPTELAEKAKGWVDRGARLLGGCCGLGEAHVRALRDVANAA